MILLKFHCSRPLHIYTFVLHLPFPQCHSVHSNPSTMRGAGVEVVGWWVGKKQNASSSELRCGVVRGIGGDIYGEGSRACQQGLWCSVELRLPLNHFPPSPGDAAYPFGPHPEGFPKLAIGCPNPAYKKALFTIYQYGYCIVVGLPREAFFCGYWQS